MPIALIFVLFICWVAPLRRVTASVVVVVLTALVARAFAGFAVFFDVDILGNVDHH
jgi:hypothetical protein